MIFVGAALRGRPLHQEGLLRRMGGHGVPPLHHSFKGSIDREFEIVARFR